MPGDGLGLQDLLATKIQSSHVQTTLYGVHFTIGQT